MASPLPGVQPVTETITSPQVSGSVFAQQPRASIGSGLEALGQGVDAIATAAATAKGQADGAQPIQRDENGKAMPIESNNFIMGSAGQAYSHALNVGMLANIQNNVGEQVNALSNKYKSDPEAFKVAVGSYADSLRSSYPGALGAAAFAHAAQLGSQMYVGSVNRNREEGLANTLQATQTRISDLGTDAENIARGTISPTTAFLDDPSTPAGAAILTRNRFLQSLADNPDWSKTYSQETIDSQIRMDKQRFINAWALGNSTLVRNAQGIDAAIQWARDNVLNSDSNMPYRERQGAFNNIVSSIQTLTTSQQAQAAASQQNVAVFTKAMAEGQYPGDVLYQNALKTARESFDAAGAGQLQAAHDVYFNRLKPLAGLPPAAGISATMGPQQPGVAKPFDPANIAGYLDKTHSIENPTGNPAARSSTGATGDFQFTHGTAAAMAAKYGSFDPNDPAQSRDMAGKLAIDNAKQLQTSLGRAPTEGEVYLAHQQGAGGAAALLAHPDENAVSALANHAGLSLEDADRNIRVNGGTPSMTAGQFAAKWTSKFDGAAPVAGANSPIPFTQAQLDANPFLAAASVRATLADKALQVNYGQQMAQIMERGISVGVVPPVEQIAKLQQIAMANPQELGDTWTKLQAHVAANPIAMMAAGSPDGGAALMAQADDLARTSHDLFHMEYASSLRSQIVGRAKMLADSPHDYASRSDVGWSAPVTPMEAIAEPQSIGAAGPQEALQSVIGTRRNSAFQISQRTGADPASLLFQKSDVDQLTNALQKSDGPAADMLLRGLSGNLNPNEMAALASNKDFSNAVAGLTRSGDPAKAGPAFSFLDKQWRENPEAFKKEYGGEMETRMQVFQDKIAWMPPDQAMKEMQRANDPGTARTIAANRDEADKFLKDANSNQVLKQLGPGWLGGWVPFTGAGAPVSNDANASASAMLADYRSNVRDLYGESGDRGQAESAALVRMQQKWGASDTNGGRVMAYPPEMHYPKDATGKQDYITQQLNQDVSDAARAHGLDLGAQPHALVSDQGTQEDIASRKPPSYKVVVADKDGHWNLLEQSPGVALRFRADASDILPGGAADKTRMLRRAQSEENMGMGAR